MVTVRLSEHELADVDRLVEARRGYPRWGRTRSDVLREALRRLVQSEGS